MTVLRPVEFDVAIDVSTPGTELGLEIMDAGFVQRVAGSFPTTQGDSGFDEIMRFLHRLAGETSREAARQHARQLAA